METQKITIEQAIEKVENNLSTVFTKDDVYNLLMSIELPKPDWSDVFDLVNSFSDEAVENVESGISRYWEDMVDYDEFELEWDNWGKKMTLMSVGFDDGRNKSYTIANDLLDTFKDFLSKEKGLDESGYPLPPEQEESALESTEMAEAETNDELDNTGNDENR